MLLPNKNNENDDFNIMTAFQDTQIALLTSLQQYQSPTLDVFFNLITATGEETFYIVIASIVLWCWNKQLAHRVGFAFLTSTVVNPTLKELFAIDRPIGVDGVDSQRLHTAEGYSFPSGHTQGATSFWFAMAVGIKNNLLWAFAIVMIALVAVSRLYLGVHWPTDVIAGIVIGVGWVLIVNALFNHAESKGKPFLLWLLVLPFLFAALAYPENKPLIVSLGASLGFLAGLQLENRYLAFCVKGSWLQHVGKVVLGLLVLLALKEGLKLVLLLPAPIADLIRYAAIGFWLTFGAPWLFIKLKLAHPAQPLDVTS